PLTARESARTAVVLAIAVHAGANEITGVTSSVKDPPPQTDRARELAFENARHKAAELARLADVNLGQVISIRETTYEPVPVEHFERSAKLMMAVEAPSPVPIDPEESEFSVTVDVTWALV